MKEVNKRNKEQMFLGVVWYFKCAPEDFQKKKSLLTALHNSLPSEKVPLKEST